MEVYAFQAALLCRKCGKAKLAELHRAAVIDSGDMDQYPQGPFADGGGEADCPQHCDMCGVFLENPLTADGVRYVRACTTPPETEVERTWATFYRDALEGQS